MLNNKSLSRDITYIYADTFSSSNGLIPDALREDIDKTNCYLLPYSGHLSTQNNIHQRRMNSQNSMSGLISFHDFSNHTYKKYEVEKISPNSMLTIHWETLLHDKRIYK